MLHELDNILARITQDGRKQTLNDHLQNVSHYAQMFGDKCSMGKILYFAGYLHDMGKSSTEWQEYLKRNDPNEQLPHSIYGAKYAYENAIKFPYAAEMLGNIIAAHHGRLYDSLAPDGETPLSDKLSDNPTHDKYDFQIDIFPIDIDTMKNEFMNIMGIAEKSDTAFFISMLTKLAFSCLVDADRLDAYLMESKEAYAPKMPNWGNLISKLEKTLLEKAAKNADSAMSPLRQKVSKDCKHAGARDIGIYKLEVPTGGGKTLSSLRFALEHAQKHKLDRIIYVIPYLSILSQTAKEIREALDADDNIVVEHHSNFLPDDEANYKLHTDRWDAPIILTTQVQLLESIFSARASDLRKLHNMTKSVIIFDEAQSMPIKCIHLFNGAMNFINRVGKSTILLCTATQPPFDDVERKIIFSENPSLTQYIETPKRYHIENAIIPSGYTYQKLAEFVKEKHQKSTLVIVNTKTAAKALYKELKNANMPVLHLSTNMCSAHRDVVIAELRRRLDKDVSEPVICVSTQLIEAGVDISLDCVIRDIAGLDSIYQAAGRCNRHGESDMKNVYVVNIKDENLSKLPDIKTGAEITLRLANENNGDIHNIDINKYYKQYFFKMRNFMDYNIKAGTIYNLLSDNDKGKGAYKDRKDKQGVNPPALRQAIRSAAEEFFVIDKGRTDVIVLYGNSEDLLNQYNCLAFTDIKGKKKLLKQIGKYSVSLYEYQINCLHDKGAIDRVSYEGLAVLMRGFYLADFGIDIDGNHEFLNA